jgi:hypothetical protein
MARDDKKYRDHEWACVYCPDDRQLQKIAIVLVFHVLRAVGTGISGNASMPGRVERGKVCRFIVSKHDE